MRRVTLTQYLIEQQRHYGKVSPELRLLIEVVARACKAISHAVSKGPLRTERWLLSYRYFRTITTLSRRNLAPPSIPE